MAVKLSDAQREILLSLLGKALQELDDEIGKRELASLRIVYRKVIADGARRERQVQQRNDALTVAGFGSDAATWTPGDPLYPYGC